MVWGTALEQDTWVQITGGGDMSSQFLKNINFLSTSLYNICARNNVILLHYIYLIHLKITFEVNQFICARLHLHGGPYK